MGDLTFRKPSTKLVILYMGAQACQRRGVSASLMLLPGRRACLVTLGLRSLGPRHARLTRHRTMLSSFTMQFIQRVEDLIEDLATAGRETVHARRLSTLRLRRAKPAALGHSRQHRIQRAWTQAIAMVLQFFKHPLTIDALLGGVVEDVDLPEGEKELAYDRIAHDRTIIALPIRSRYSITWRDVVGGATGLRAR